MRAILIGGGGFIGSATARALIARGDEALSVDRQIGGAPAGALAELKASGRFTAVKADAADVMMMTALIREYRPDCILHMPAAKPGASLVDVAAARHAALLGVLESATAYWASLSAAGKGAFRLVVAATDAVYAPLGPIDPAFDDAKVYDPINVDGAAEAGALMAARAWSRAEGLPLVIAHAGRCYGPWQGASGFLPKLVRGALGEGAAILSDPETIRDWLHVADFAAGMIAAAERGRAGAAYHFSAYAERRVVDVARAVCTLLDAKRPRALGSHVQAIETPDDMLDAGLRFALDPSRAAEDLAWRAERSLHLGLAETVDWILSQTRAELPARAAE